MSGRDSAVALGIGYVLNPLVLPPALFAIVLEWSGAPPFEIGRAALVVFVLMTGLPLLGLLWMVRSGRAATVNDVERDERRTLFGIGIGCTLVAVAFVHGMVEAASGIVGAIGACIIGTAGVLALVNQRWKASIHTAAIAGFVTVLILLPVASEDIPRNLTALWLIPLVPLVMWSRVRTQSHTGGEVLAGCAVGITVPVSILLGLSAAGVV